MEDIIIKTTDLTSIVGRASEKIMFGTALRVLFINMRITWNIAL